MRTSIITLGAIAPYATRHTSILRSILYAAIIAVFLVRSSLDTVLDIVQIGIGSGSSLTLGAAFNAGLIAITLLLLLMNTKPLNWAIQAPWLIFIAYCAVMSIPTTDPIGVVRLLLVIVSYQCAFMLPFLLIRSASEARQFVNVIIYSSFLPALVALDQIPYAPAGEEGRIASTFTHPNILAFYTLVVMAAIAFRLVSSLYNDTLAKRCLLIAYGMAQGMVLLSTQTRSSWLAATLFLAAYAIFVDRRALLAFFCLPAVVAVSPSIQQRLLDAISPAEYVGSGVILNSYEWRQLLWHNALSWIYESPILGHGGLGSFLTYSPQFFQLESNGVYAHNVYIQLAFETGVLGAVLYAAIFVFAAWRFIRVYKFDRAASVIGVTFCIIYLTLSYSDNMLYYLACNWYVFMFLATLMVITSRTQPLRGGAPAGGRSIRNDRNRHGRGPYHFRRRRRRTLPNIA